MVSSSPQNRREFQHGCCESGFKLYWDYQDQMWACVLAFGGKQLPTVIWLTETLLFLFFLNFHFFFFFLSEIISLVGPKSCKENQSYQVLNDLHGPTWPGRSIWSLLPFSQITEPDTSVYKQGVYFGKSLQRTRVRRLETVMWRRESCPRMPAISVSNWRSQVLCA